MRVPWQKVLPGWCPTANSGECMFFPLRGKLRYGRGAKSRGKPAPNQRAANLRQQGPPNDKAAKGPQKKGHPITGLRKGRQKGRPIKGLAPLPRDQAPKGRPIRGLPPVGVWAL